MFSRIPIPTDERKIKTHQIISPKKAGARESLFTNTKAAKRAQSAIPDRREFDSPEDSYRSISPPYSVDDELPERLPHWSSLELRAGKESGNYQRAPFIQKKKKVNGNLFLKNPSLYRVSSEPCLQKKRIAMYPKNHNILRTYTVKEEVRSTLFNCLLTMFTTI